MADPVSIDSRAWTGDAESRSAPYRVAPAVALEPGWGGGAMVGAMLGVPLHGFLIHFVWRGLGSPAMVRGTPSTMSVIATILTFVALWWWGRNRAGRARDGFRAAFLAMTVLTAIRTTELVMAVNFPAPVNRVSLMVNGADGFQFGRRTHHHLAANIHAVDQAGWRQDIEVPTAFIRGIVAGDSCVSLSIERDRPFRMIRQMSVRSVGDGKPRLHVWDEMMRTCFAR
jgi:hypothetical protein